MTIEDISVVILHYNSIEETQNCIKSIRQISECNIVIVCNGSSNNSDYELPKIYGQSENIFILINEKNEGFAKGLNKGILYAKTELYSIIIICLNNDIEMIQEDFFENLLSYANANEVGVIGPDIVNLSGVHQNPSAISKDFKCYAIAERRKALVGINRCKTFFGLPEIVYCIFRKIRPARVTSRDKNEIIKIHGACLILGPLFLKQYDGLCPDTFLYGEEDILSFMCYKNHIPMSYVEKLRVLHREAVSTKVDMKNLRKRHLFYYENLFNSENEFLKMIEKMEG